jgi:hypothetical protein
LQSVLSAGVIVRGAHIAPEFIQSKASRRLAQFE